jgi:hypothetical protein
MSSGVLSSIGWPLKYPSTEVFQQKWVINITDGYAIKLLFMDFHLPADTNGNKSCATKGLDMVSITGN